MSDVPLKEYLEVRLNNIDAKLEKAEQRLETRLAGMNEFRGALADQAASQVTRAEYVMAHKNLEEKIRGLELSRANSDGRAAQTAALVAVIASIIVGVIVAAVTHFLKL